MSRLSVPRALLHNELDLRLERTEGYDTWKFPDEVKMDRGREEVAEYFRLVTDPVHLERFGVSHIRQFWKARRDWNDVVIVGAGPEGWWVLHWYTTA